MKCGHYEGIFYSPNYNPNAVCNDCWIEKNMKENHDLYKYRGQKIVT